MVKIGDVWDSTTDVLAGRAGLLASIAALAFVLPSVVQTGFRLVGGTSPGAALLSALIGLAVLVAAIWGQLAVIAVASDPATTQRDAGRQAGARLPAALLVVLVIGAGALLLAMPIGIALGASGYDFAAASAAASPDAMPPMAPGAARFTFLYALALAAFFLWLSARLVLLNAVILNEGRKVGAIGCSLALTRGLTLKLIAVTLLFGLVYGVALLAARSVVGITARLIFGSEGTGAALFVASIAGAALFAAYLVVLGVFAARLYAAVTRAP